MKIKYVFEVLWKFLTSQEYKEMNHRELFVAPLHRSSESFDWLCILQWSWVYKVEIMVVHVVLITLFPYILMLFPTIRCDNYTTRSDFVLWLLENSCCTVIEYAYNEQTLCLSAYHHPEHPFLAENSASIFTIPPLMPVHCNLFSSCASLSYSY